MRRMLIVFSLLGVLGPPSAAASGWVQRVGHCYGKLWDRSLFGSRAYSAEGLRDIQEVPSYQDHLISLYGECGIHGRLTVLLQASPAGYAAAGERDTFYIGPIIGGARFALLQGGPVALAVEGRYGYAPPVGDVILTETTFVSAGSTRRAIFQPTVENHTGELQLGAGLGFALGEAPAYWAAAVGVRFNSAPAIDHALVAHTKVGVTLWRRLALALHLALYEPFFQAVELTNTAGAGQTRYLGFGLSASYWFVPYLAAFANLDGVLYAESNAATPSLGIGLETRFALWTE